MIAQNLVWVEFFMLLSIVMLVLVPRETIVRLLPFGLVAGFVVALIIQLLAVPLLGLWSFNYVSFVAYKGIPIFVALAWVPSTIIFAHYVNTLDSPLLLYLISIGFALISSIVEYLFVHYGYREYQKWNIMATFALALALHGVMAYYLTSRKQT